MNYEPVMCLYDQAWRHYHNRDHVKDTHLAASKIIMANEYKNVDYRNLSKAIDLHDVVYTVGGKNNEEACALIAESLFLPEVARLIRLTKDHQPVAEDTIGTVMVDADLYGLRNRGVYHDNGVKIRNEVMQWCYYQGIDWDNQLWVMGRTAWLESFLQREQIFFTPWMQQFDADARENMQRELDELQQS